MLTLIQMQYFVDVVTQGSFTLAAQKNLVSQTAISQQVAKMEAQLGAQLLDRTQKPLALTTVGQVAYDQALIVLQQYAHLRQAVAAVRQDVRPSLRCGYLEYLENDIVSRAATQLAAWSPAAQLTLSARPFDQLAAQLQSGELDLAIGLRSAFPERAPLAYQQLAAGPYAVLIQAGSPLAARPALTGAELAGQELILQDRRTLGPAFDQLLAHCRADGVNPTIAQLVDDPQTAALMVALERGIAFTLPQRSAPAGTVMRPLTQTHHRYSVVLAKRRDDDRPLVLPPWAKYKQYLSATTVSH